MDLVDLVNPGARARLAAFLQDLVLPTDCVGCGRVGPAVCASCRARLVPDVTVRTVRGLRVHSALRYEGVVAEAVVAFKNEGRTGLAPPLASALRAAVAAALEDAPGAAPLLVPMARTRRSAVERGYDPVRLLLRRAGLPAAGVLQAVGRSRDQLALGRDDRFANVAATVRALPAVAGHRVVLVDDVVTTGATLTEAARAVAEAGGAVVGAATVASTPSRRSL